MRWRFPADQSNNVLQAVVSISPDIIVQANQSSSTRILERWECFFFLVTYCNNDEIATKENCNPKQVRTDMEDKTGRSSYGSQEKVAKKEACWRKTPFCYSEDRQKIKP